MSPRASRGRALLVVGTRPEAIKMAPVYRALRRRADTIETRLVLTGQHDDLVDEALSCFRMVPDWDLGIMREGQSLTEVAGHCLTGMEGVFADWRPDLLLVQGDTASVFFGAVAAYFQHIPTGHVEAGLRTGDLHRPFPEEGFRRMTAVVADLHFAPTEGARENLLREGVPPERIHVTGNTVVDALLEVAAREEEPSEPVLRRLRSSNGSRFALLTAHRRESFGAPLERVFRAVRELVEREESLEILFPVHPNPAVRGPAEEILGHLARVHLVEPLGYADLVSALSGAELILTDSGGIQEEAPTFGTPVLVLRDLTERPEGLVGRESGGGRGVARVVGTDPETIVREARSILSQARSAESGAADPAPGTGASAERGPNPFGDGGAGERIAERVAVFLATGSSA